MLGHEFSIIPTSRCFEHPDASRIFDSVLQEQTMKDVVIDLSKVQDATTSAFARLVLLRRQLLRDGRDLRLTGLRDRAARLYEVSRLDTILPRC